jgi:hypothetical protein
VSRRFPVPLPVRCKICTTFIMSLRVQEEGAKRYLRVTHPHPEDPICASSIWTDAAALHHRSALILTTKPFLRIGMKEPIKARNGVITDSTKPLDVDVQMRLVDVSVCASKAVFQLCRCLRLRCTCANRKSTLSMAPQR